MLLHHARLSVVVTTLETYFHVTISSVEQAEFRFYWLKSKMEEMPSLSELSGDNAFVFTSLAYHQCSVSTMTSVMASESLFGQDGPALDGLLFYHSEAHYVPGRTPLVGWLKPHMMATVLSVPVASVYLHTGKKNRRKFQKRRRKSQVNFEIEISCYNRDKKNGVLVVIDKFWVVTNAQLGFWSSGNHTGHLWDKENGAPQST